MQGARNLWPKPHHGQAALYATSLSRKQSEGCRSRFSLGFAVVWNDARSVASFGPTTPVNLSMVVLKSLAFICCNSIVIVMSYNPLLHSGECCNLCASKLPPSIRARLTTERLLQAAHSSPRPLLMISQSRHITAFQRGTRSAASRWFLVSPSITHLPSVATTRQSQTASNAVESHGISARIPALQYRLALPPACE
jgi:hypothetical protein